ncbi:response regulator [Vulgatibacter sp.]|uniref:response regulator n=1 Tax=Vulgatibacter sp. TaxID=1971226 RepID=UPI0035687452
MGGRVLVVEDDLVIRDTLLEILADAGYEAIGAANGLEALARLREPGGLPCLIVLDIMMPVMDGVTFRQEQLRLPELAGIPVVVLSAHRTSAELVDDLGVRDVLPKPVRLAQLLCVVHRFCGLGA